MKIKRLLAVLLVMTAVASVFAIPASANNQSSGGTPIAGSWRDKEDYSSSYIYNYPESGGNLKAWINSGPFHSSPIKVDRWYCGIMGGQYIPYNGPASTVWIQPGVSKYMNNYCREDYYYYSGYSHPEVTTTGDPCATVGFICWTEGKYYKLAWSPDSV